MRTLVEVEPESLPLVERLGGAGRIDPLVERLWKSLCADPMLAKALAGVDAEWFKKSEAAFLIQAFGGPGSTLDVREPLELDSEQVSRFLLHVRAALDELPYPHAVKDEAFVALLCLALRGGGRVGPLEPTVHLC